MRFSAAALLLAVMPALLAQEKPAPPKPTTAAEAPTRDTSYIDENGTAHVTRVVPVPEDLSPQAKASLSRREPDQGPPQSLAQRRKMTDAYTAGAKVEWTKICPNTLTDTTIAGVPVHVVVPEGMPDENKGKVLLNLHGGGFNSDSGSYTESIPIASFT
ncbi:MAG: alpha/beta hydrolase, partial [Proteobacteria bacterium]